jgi:hypothetical protein
MISPAMSVELPQFATHGIARRADKCPDLTEVLIYSVFSGNLAELAAMARTNHKRNYVDISYPDASHDASR